MLFRPAAVTDLALRLHIDNVVRERLKGRQLAYTDALARTLDDVRCPVHGIYGREDALYRPRTAQLESVLRRAPDFRGLALVDDAGHWVQFERSEVFDRLLLATL